MIVGIVPLDSHQGSREMTAFEIARATFELPLEERTEFLDRVCSGQPALRDEVESLIRNLAAEESSTFVAEDVAAMPSRGASQPIESNEGSANSGSTMAAPDSGPGTTNLGSTVDEGTSQNSVKTSSGTRIDSAAPQESAGTYVTSGTDVGRGAAPPSQDSGSLGTAVVSNDSEPPAHRQQPAEEATGETIAGRYRLVRKIGEGGMGEVWIAQQSEPVKRRVALKLIKSGMDTRAVLARFEQERQALALMDHPNIAKVFDAGKTPGGQPFFVMELVEGEPLTKFCDEELLTLESRLELFVPICQAVQHAHQKGIVHRDLKPANVLVTEVDGRPVPKVIDFGVAKATAGKITDQTMDTQFGAVIGTLEYMSPEQAGGAVDDIDTRADIYSLGVILYELLTGLRPIDRTQLQKAALTEMIRIIREVEPSKPSTRLSTSEALPSLAAVRRIEPRKLTAALRGELDWVVMKCLEKSRERRYETASGLARDIQRFLADEPVEARPASKAYRLRKLLARNKVTAIAAGLIFLSLVGGIIGTSLALAEAKKARQAADEASAAATAKAVAEARERQRAELAEAETRKRAEELEQVAAFQSTQLAGIKPNEMGGMIRADVVKRRRDTLQAAKLEKAEIDRHIGDLEKELAGVNFTNVALDALDENIFDRALKTIDEKFVDQPVIRARLLQTLADTMLQLGLLEKAIAPQNQAIEIRRKTLGDSHPETQESIEDLGSILAEQGKFEEAIPVCREVLAIREKTLGPEHPLTMRSRVALAYVLVSLQRFEEPNAFLPKTTEDCRRVLGPEDELTIRSLNTLGLSLMYQGKFKEAEAPLREAFESGRRKFGIENYHTLNSCSYLFNTILTLGKMPEAEALARDSVQASRNLLGDDHPNTLVALDNLAKTLRRQNKLAESEALYREILAAEARVLGTDHVSYLVTLNNLANTLVNAKRGAEAEVLARECLEKTRRIRGSEHVETLIALNTMGQTLAAQGKPAEAIPFWRENLETSRRVFGEDHPETIIYSYNLGSVLMELGRLEEAQSYLRDAFEKCRKGFGPDHPNTQIMQATFGNVLLKLRKYDEAEPFLANSLAFAEKNNPGDIAYFRTKASLGQVFSGQKKFAEAEPLLKAAYDGLKSKAESLLPRYRPDLFETAEKLAAIYDATDRKGEADKLRAEIDGLRKKFEAASPKPAQGK